MKLDFSKMCKRYEKPPKKSKKPKKIESAAATPKSRPRQRKTIEDPTARHRIYARIVMIARKIGATEAAAACFAQYLTEDPELQVSFRRHKRKERRPP